MKKALRFDLAVMQFRQVNFFSGKLITATIPCIFRFQFYFSRTMYIVRWHVMKLSKVAQCGAAAIYPIALSYLLSSSFQ